MVTNLSRIHRVSPKIADLFISYLVNGLVYFVVVLNRMFSKLSI